MQLDKTFLASINEHGVIQPVAAHRVEGGGVHVLCGQWRTLAAVETAQPLIPLITSHGNTEARETVNTEISTIVAEAS